MHKSGGALVYACSLRKIFPGSDTGCTFGEYIRKKSQKSSILQEDSCGNTALNKEKRNFRKKIQFVPPFSHSKRGTKRRFSHICSFETCKYTDSVKFRRKWMTKSKKTHIVPHYLEQPFQDLNCYNFIKEFCFSY